MGVEYWKIDEKLLAHISKIARLELSEDEIKKFLVQLQEVLTNFKKIDEVDVAGIEPSIHPTAIKNVWREDRFEPFVWKPLEQTSHKEKKFFKGPRIV